MLLPISVYEKVDSTSLRDVQALLDWSELRVYDLNEAGKNHGICWTRTDGNPSKLAVHVLKHSWSVGCGSRHQLRVNS